MNYKNHSHDFLSACLVRFRSLGVGRAPDVFVAVLTNDSNISSSPSVKFSSVCLKPLPLKLPPP